MTTMQHPNDLCINLGQITISKRATQEFTINEIFHALNSQATGDWGTIDGQELDSNEFSAKWGGELFSRYGTYDRQLIVITDNNITNVYTNSEY